MTLKSGRVSVPRLVVDSSRFLKNAIDKYVCFNLMSYVYGNVAFISSYNLYDHLGMTAEDLAEFCRRRKQKDFEGKELIDSKRSCFENTEASVYVTPIGARKERKESYEVDFTNLAYIDDPPERKLKSLKNLTATCDCKITKKMRICRPPVEQRLEHGDMRTYKDIPTSNIESAYCKHAVAAQIWLSVVQEAEDFTLFALPPKGTEIIRRVISDVLIHQTPTSRVPDYKLNRRYNKFYNFQEDMFGYLVKLASFEF